MTISISNTFNTATVSEDDLHARLKRALDRLMQTPRHSLERRRALIAIEHAEMALCAVMSANRAPVQAFRMAG